MNFQGTYYFSGDEQRLFLQKYKESNAAVANDYMKRNDGILFEEDIRQGEDYPIKEYSQKDLIAICGKVIALQEKQIDKLKEEYKSLTFKKLLIKKIKTIFKN